MSTIGSTETTKARLLQAGANLFARHGYDSVALEAIGEVVGIRRASIFHHFPGGKPELYETILKRISETFTEKLRIEVGLGNSPVEVLVSICSQYWDYCAEFPDQAGLVVRECLDLENARAREFHFSNIILLRLFREFVTNAQQSGKLRLFEVDHFLFWAGSYCLTFHGAPGLRVNLWIDVANPASEIKGRYLQDIRAYIEPRG